MSTDNNYTNAKKIKIKNYSRELVHNSKQYYGNQQKQVFMYKSLGQRTESKVPLSTCIFL